MYNMVNTDVICPECGEGYMIREEPKVIKSNTERYAYLCPCCGFVHTAKSDEDMKEWIKSLDKPIEEIPKEQNRWGLAMMDALGEACEKEMEKWSLEEREQAKENLKKSIDRAVEIGNTKHHVKGETDYHAKHDEGKLQIHLVPTQIIRDIAEVRMYGNKKYGDPNNWEQVEKIRYLDALLRHLLTYRDYLISGNLKYKFDEESGIEHHKHAATNMAFICDKEAKGE